VPYSVLWQRPDLPLNFSQCKSQNSKRLADRVETFD
jgi:hypothetical protein